MKIGLVSPYDFSYPGGVTNHIIALEREFTRMGNDVRVIAPASKVLPEFDGRLILIGKPRPVPGNGSIVRITISLRLASQIKAVLEREKFDIVHLHEPFMPMLCSAMLRFSNVVNIGTFHACEGGIGYNIAWPFSKYLLKRRSRTLHGKIAVSETAKRFANKFLPGDYTIIPNGVDLKHFTTSVSPIEEFCDDKLNILFVGRLERRKGVKFLLDAYKVIKGKFPNCRLIIVGPGTVLREQYKAKVRLDNLKDVVFLGNVAHSDLPRYYKTADVVCFPATGGESFGMVLLEAMAVGKPVVATDIEGYAGVVNDDVEGLLVPPRNTERLAEAILTLLNDEALRKRLGNTGLLSVQQYNWKSVAQKVFSYYLKVLGEPLWNRQLPELQATPVPVIKE